MVLVCRSTVQLLRMIRKAGFCFGWDFNSARQWWSLIPIDHDFSVPMANERIRAECDDGLVSRGSGAFSPTVGLASQIAIEVLEPGDPRVGVVMRQVPEAVDELKDGQWTQLPFMQDDAVASPLVVFAVGFPSVGHQRLAMKLLVTTA